MIRLGRWQRVLIRRCFGSPAGYVYPLGKREREALAGLLRREMLRPVAGLPGCFEIPDQPDWLKIHLRGAILQHPEETP